jgi:hypothetical protein
VLSRCKFLSPRNAFPQQPTNTPMTVGAHVALTQTKVQPVPRQYPASAFRQLPPSPAADEAWLVSAGRLSPQDWALGRPPRLAWDSPGGHPPAGMCITVCSATRNHFILADRAPTTCCAAVTLRSSPTYRFCTNNAVGAAPVASALLAHAARGSLTMVSKGYATHCPPCACGGMLCILRQFIATPAPTIQEHQSTAA